MADSSAQQEPSMEEILASIRRIISEDGEEEASGVAPGGELKEVTAKQEPDEATEEPAEDAAAIEAASATDVNEDDVPAETSDEPASDAPEPDGAASDVDFDAIDVDTEAAETEAEPEPAAKLDPVLEAKVDRVPEPAASPAMAEADDVLDLTEEAPDDGRGPLVSHGTEAVATEHLRALSGMMVKNYPGAENTLEGLVREMLKPMLREWLDANLPQLVEKAVNREIARIAGREQ